MDLRSVLLLTYHFPPSAASGSFRLLGFARHLPKFGWRAVVVAPQGLPWEAQDPALVRQLPAETALEYAPYPSGWLSYPFRVLAPIRCWLPGAWRQAVRAVRRHRPAAILTSGPDHYVHGLGLALKRRYGLPLIADFRDPWIACNPAAGRLRPLIRRWEARQERAVMARADVIIANAPNACEALARAFPQARERIVTLTNGFDPERFEGLAAGTTAGDGPLTLLHPGQLYAGRDPRPLLDALRAYQAGRPPSARPIRVDFIGNLAADLDQPDLTVESRARGLEGIVTVGGPVPYAQSLARMVQADILLLLDSPGRRNGVPAKLYEYVGAGRPVLALGEPDGDTAWVLRACGVPHRIAPPGDAEAIRRALAELVAELETQPAVRGSHPGRLQFTRENLTRQLAVILDRCAATSPAGAEIGAPVASSTRPTEAIR